MAVGLTVALGWPLSPWPWLYPLYYVALLFPRQHFDDALRGQVRRRGRSTAVAFLRIIPYSTSAVAVRLHASRAGTILQS